MRELKSFFYVQQICAESADGPHCLISGGVLNVDLSQPGLGRFFFYRLPGLTRLLWHKSGNGPDVSDNQG